MDFTKQKSGLLVPKVKEKPKKPERPTSWYCPRCGEFFDRETAGEVEEATVGTLNPDSIPHINCPKCNKCMGCFH